MNNIEWNHIMEKQPLNGELIVHCDKPYKGHYPIGMREYSQLCSFERVIEFYKEFDLDGPDFWWVTAKDFPFPI